MLRSYCIGAAHLALGWVTSEGLAVDDDGEVHDLTIRSFGIVRAVDMPPVEVEVGPGTGPPVRRPTPCSPRWRPRSGSPRLPAGRGRRGGPHADVDSRGPYTPVVEAGAGSSCRARSGRDGTLVNGGFDGQCAQAIANLEAGSPPRRVDADVVKTTCFLRHMADYAAHERDLLRRLRRPPAGPLRRRRGRAAHRRPLRGGGLGPP